MATIATNGEVGGPAGGSGWWQASAAGDRADVRSVALAAFERAGGPAEFGFAGISGSTQVGLGHALSDVDVYVVAAGGGAVDERVQEVDGVPVQLNGVPADTFRRLCDVGAEFTATTRDRDDLDLPPWDYKMLVALLEADVIHAAEPYATAHAGLNRTAVRRLFMSANAIHVARFAEDALGGLDGGRPLIAIRAAALALEHAMVVACAAGGDLYPSAHLTYQRAARVGVLDDATWRVVSGLPRWDAPEPEVRRHTEGALGLAGQLVASALVDGWDAVAAATATQATETPQPLRSPYWHLLRFSDGFALAGPDQGLRISPDIALLWRHLDVGPLADVADRMVRATDGRIQAREVEEAVAELRELGPVPAATTHSS